MSLPSFGGRSKDTQRGRDYKVSGFLVPPRPSKKPLEVADEIRACTVFFEPPGKRPIRGQQQRFLRTDGNTLSREQVAPRVEALHVQDVFVQLSRLKWFGTVQLVQTCQNSQVKQRRYASVIVVVISAKRAYRSRHSVHVSPVFQDLFPQIGPISIVPLSSWYIDIQVLPRRVRSVVRSDDRSYVIFLTGSQVFAPQIRAKSAVAHNLVAFHVSKKIADLLGPMRWWRRPHVSWVVRQNNGYVEATLKSMLAVEVPLVRASVARGGGGETNVDSDACVAAHEALAKRKREVPHVVARVGRARWNALVNVSSAIERRTRDRTVVNRAYHKMHELLLSCALPRVTRSVHLCEAPGGFVQCVAHHLARGDGEWRWVAMSLDATPRFAVDQLPMRYGRIVLGDVCDVDACARDCTNAMTDCAAEEEDKNKDEADAGIADLVTADGAVEMDHDRLEADHLPLLRAECDVATRLLRLGGTFVVKFFEGLTVDTRRVLAWTSQHFERTSVINPRSSRPTNSERYLVCTQFRGRKQDAMRVNEATFVAPEWDARFQEVLVRMATEQTRRLDETLMRAR